RYDDVALEYKDISNGVGDIFTTTAQQGENWGLNGILWEPGKTEVVYLAVENAGKLALNYNLILNVTNDSGNQAALEEALTYAIVPNVDRTQVNPYGSWSQILADASDTGAVPAGYSTAAPNGALEAGQTDYFALAVHMNETAGNEFQAQALTIDVQVVAKQMAHEYDSFDNQYDANAGFVQAEIYVSPDGDDAGAGTADSPFKTLARAQQEVRTMNASMWGDIYVYLADGVYTLDDTLTFGVEDGGSNGHYVRYVATGDATISGGRKIEGWTKSAEYENLYVANVANFTGAGIGEMYVNDVYAKRAQSEDYGLIISESDVDTSDVYVTDRLVVDSEVLSKASVTVGNVSDILLRLNRAWKTVVVNVEDITDNGDGTSSLHVHLSAAASGDSNELHGVDPGAGFVVLNAFAELDQPGEFYFDETSGDLYYYPREGEDMATAEVYASELEELIAIEGNSMIDKTQNIAFENLTFAHVAWYGEMTDGFFLQQASTYWNDEGTQYNQYIPGGINLTNTYGISFTGSVFKGFHGGALALNSGAENTQIVGNVFEDIGDSAIVLGSDDLIKDEEVYGANYTLNKPVTSYLQADYTVKNYDHITDNTPTNGYWDWLASEKAFYGDFTKPTFQVDLGAAYKIDELEILHSSSAYSKKGYSVYASATQITSTADLESTADKIASVDTSVDGASQPQTVIHKLDSAYSDKEYRYVYYVVDDGIYKHVFNMKVKDASGNNIANGATVTSYVFSDYEPINYTKITDSISDGAWTDTNKQKFVAGFTKATFQVDMEELCNIDKIELQHAASWPCRMGYSIYGSATQLTSTAAIESQADKLVSVPAVTKEADGVVDVAPVFELEDQYKAKQYRYLYFVDENGGWMTYVIRFAAINETLVNAAAQSLPKDNTITDNYITRCGLVNQGAPGVTAYYTHNLDCSYNEFYDLPYSGISLGWGWKKGYEQSVASGNRVAYNKIHNIMEVMWDGGAIYTLGHLNGSEITSNHIYDVPNVLGGIYQDQGSAGLEVYNNVVENVPNAFTVSNMNNGNGAFLNYHDNYISANEHYNGKTCGAIFYNPGDYPLEAAKVVMESGIRDEYVGIKAKDSGRQEELTTEVIFENLMHGDSAVISNEIYRRYILIVNTLYLDKFLEFVETDGSIGSYPAELVQAVKDQRVLCEQLQGVVPPDRVAMAEATAELQRLLIQMRESRVTDTLEDLIAQAEEKLANADVGTQVGQIYQSTYDALAEAVAESKATLESGDVALADRVYLEKCIERFDNEKIALDIFSFDLPEGLMSAEIDNANHEINIVVRRTLDLTNVAPIIEIPSSVMVTPASGETVDLSNGGQYTVSTTDGTESQVWTVNVTTEPILTGDIALDATVENSANWVKGLGGNEDKYHAQLFGDSTITFNLKVDKHAATDYPGFTFRNSRYDAMTSSAAYGAGNGYTVIFNTDDNCSLELQRWNDKKRVWFDSNYSESTTYVTVKSVKDIFKFGEENKIELTTANVTDGVQIIIKVNDQEVINCIDKSANAVTDAGYLGTFYVYQTVEISAAD
ncbi:MAG: right-handed parallel beta-helix repeat-containing protein, partial [Lachnospiraceae bacterium]|nr:right-handed parallel beta-helix repeat-containing protein [Lachnospiraceae bacterium]